MRLTSVRLVNFRNHSQTQFVPADRFNVLLGENGEGKTNILEAISYLCLTKSFFGGSDRIALQLGKEQFIVEGALLSDNEIRHSVRVEYNSTENRKRVWINSVEPETFSEVMGRFPVVVLSPESYAITHGSPTERRKFLDLVLAQASKVYLEHLIEYRRCLKQRNKILFDAKVTRQNPADMLEPWNVSLAEHGAHIIARRFMFLQEFRQYVADAFRRLTDQKELPVMRYEGSPAIESELTVDEIRQRFLAQLDARLPEEQQRATTVVGPHRDEVEFFINDRSLRAFASQGQHKTFLVALKVAEFFYLKDRCNETPILLLDDILSEFDEHRAERVLTLAQQLGQTFMTSTSEQFFSGYEGKEHAKKFSVRRGIVTHEEAHNYVG
jgi:DNA replication and repair protein RecF